MDSDKSDQWLHAYGNAGETSDPQAVTRLFTPDVVYFWTLFEEPKRAGKG